jgi:uncharacterized Zn finger protein (UPF0148 family)
MPTTAPITCPKCGHQFNIEDVVAHQLEEKTRTELDEKASALQADYEMMEQV